MSTPAVSLLPPLQVTHVYKGEVAVDGDAFDLAWYAPGMLGVADDAVEPIREKRVVLNVRSAHQAGKQVRLAQVENLPIDSVERALDAISRHAVRRSVFRCSPIETTSRELVNAHKAR